MIFPPIQHWTDWPAIGVILVLLVAFLLERRGLINPRLYWRFGWICAGIVVLLMILAKTT